MDGSARPGHRAADAGAAVPFGVIGTGCVIAGGLLAAATAFEPSQRGMWAVAYLVLVAGVAQVALGAGQALLAPRRPSWATVASQLATFNLGNAAVLAGALLGVPAAVDAGGGALVVSLALLIRGVHGAGSHRAWPLYAYRLLVGILLVSIPIGLVLARTGPV